MTAEIIPISQANNYLAKQETEQYVTMRLDGQLFGLSVLAVQDILKELRITPIPLAPHEITGALNLRGRIVTVVDMRRRLGLSGVQESEKNMVVVVEHHGDLYSLIVDEVGDVLRLSKAEYEKTPSNLPGNWAAVSKGVFRLENEIMVVLDIENLLEIGA